MQCITVAEGDSNAWISKVSTVISDAGLDDLTEGGHGNLTDVAVKESSSEERKGECP